MAVSTERLRALRDALLTGLVERDEAIRLALIAALSGEHLLMVGPPGTAKSLVARRLHLAFKESTYFERLLTRFTVPEELFGPLSIKGLEEDRYERLTHKYLPSSSIAFLDEIFKANSAILNSLLTLLNEREFDNGTERVTTPLVAVIGASNELPQDEELEALFDRFLLRLHVGPVSKNGFPSLLGLRGQASPAISENLKLSTQELSDIQTAAELVTVPDDVLAMLCELRDWCTAESIPVSDRRWRKVVKLLQTSALTNGQDAVSVWDCWLLQHCLWNTPEDREKVYSWYCSKVGATADADPSRLTRIIVLWEAKLRADQESRSQRRDEQGNPLYMSEDGEPTTVPTHMPMKRNGAQVYRAPEHSHVLRGNSYINDLTNGGRGYTIKELDDDVGVRGSNGFRSWNRRDEYLSDRRNWMMLDTVSPGLMEPTKQKQVYVDECLREISKLKNDVVAYKKQLESHVDSLDRLILSHLWISTDFSIPAKSSLNRSAEEIDALLARLTSLIQGFEGLPIEGALEPLDVVNAHPRPSRPKLEVRRVLVERS